MWKLVKGEGEGPPGRDTGLCMGEGSKYQEMEVSWLAGRWELGSNEWQSWRSGWGS